MSGGIYLLRGEDELVEMREAPYDSEDILQELIARFPSLLAGDQYGADAPRRWLLVGREASLPDDEDGGGRWSVDHLFLDQDAVPTLVEVKRSTDTRIRREVVGQMLDYAANAVVYWPIERLRELLLRRCGGDDGRAADLVAEVAGEESDADVFWEHAQENMRAGKLRLVFVADEIPRELRRVIEFLNGQMTADVLGIEVKQYVGEGMRTLVPRVIGQTAEVEARKGTRPASGRRKWDQESYFAELAAKLDEAETHAVRELYEWTRLQGMNPAFGTGKVDGSWLVTIAGNGLEYRPLSVYTSGIVYLQFESLKPRPPFDREETRLELLRRANEIPGVSLGTDMIDRNARIPLSVIVDRLSADSLKAVLAWIATTTAIEA